MVIISCHVNCYIGVTSYFLSILWILNTVLVFYNKLLYQLYILIYLGQTTSNIRVTHIIYIFVFYVYLRIAEYVVRVVPRAVYAVYF